MHHGKYLTGLHVSDITKVLHGASIVYNSYLTVIGVHEMHG